VLFIVWDDTGFGAWEPFGGPIEILTLKRLADSGMRYTQFHTTAICSPTRAALLTGRNYTTVGIREYFDEMGHLEQAILPHGVIALGKQAMGNLCRLIGGTEYAMTTVSRL
jgi:arylsulfatase A-like enzyme